MSRPARSKSAERCPVCRQPRDETFKPFCSKRCADIDLARWLGGRYVIPEKATDDDEPRSPAGRDDGDR